MTITTQPVASPQGATGRPPRRRSSWTNTVAVLLVPLLVAGALLWGTWNPDSRLRQVQAAVVNNDEMVTINGQVMPLGRQLSAELVDSKKVQNFTWVLADEKRARDGLIDGTYAAVVTIPKDFSARATSFSSAADQAESALITVATSPVTGISETVLGQYLADAAATSLDTFLTEEYLKNIYVGFNTMSDQFIELRNGTRELADGATKLSDGTATAADGGRQLASGMDQLDAGGAKLDSGASQLSSGAAQLAAGTKKLDDGIDQLAAGAHQLADGTTQLAAGADQLAAGQAQYASGVDAYVAGVDQYTDGVSQYVGAINPVVKGLRDLVARLPDWGDLVVQLDPIMAALPQWNTTGDPQVQALVTQLNSFLDTVGSLIKNTGDVKTAAAVFLQQLQGAPIACPASLADTPGACDAFEQGVAAQRAQALAAYAPLATQLSQVNVDAATATKYLTQLRTSAAQVAALSSQLADYAPQATKAWAAFKAQLPGGSLTRADLLALLDRLIGGGDALVSGGSDLDAGGVKLAAGAHQLAAGGAELATGAHGVATGASGLADGLDRYASGTHQFTAGVTKLAGGLSAFEAGVGQYTDGVSKAADGTTSLANGLDQLSSGAHQLADGTDRLADGVAEGADKIPTYSKSERERLSSVVASPIDTAGLTGLVGPTIAWASLLLVVALWLGALATWVARKALDTRNVTSNASNSALWWRTLAPGLGLVTVQALLLVALAGGVMGLSASTIAGLAVVLLLAGASFAVVNHALVAWAGNGGRLASGAFVLVTAVAALSYASQGIFGSLRMLSPVSPALDAVRAILVGTSPTTAVLALVGWALVGGLAGAVSIARSRTVRLAALVAS